MRPDWRKDGPSVGGPYIERAALTHVSEGVECLRERIRLGAPPPHHLAVLDADGTVWHLTLDQAVTYLSRLTAAFNSYSRAYGYEG